MKRTLTALTVVTSLIASGVYAYDSKTLEVLWNLSKVKTEEVERILSGAAEGTLKEKNERRERLRSALEEWESQSQAGVDLSSANLSGFILRDVALKGADLSGANLAGADLDGSNLTGAFLRGSNLRGTDLRKANLFRADLTDADLSGAILKEADLTRAKMNGAILCNTIMPDGSVIYSGC